MPELHVNVERSPFATVVGLADNATLGALDAASADVVVADVVVADVLVAGVVVADVVVVACEAEPPLGVLVDVLESVPGPHAASARQGTSRARTLNRLTV